MSRRRVAIVCYPNGPWLTWTLLRPVEAARRERVRRQVQRVKRRAARRWAA